MTSLIFEIFKGVTVPAPVVIQLRGLVLVPGSWRIFVAFHDVRVENQQEIPQLISAYHRTGKHVKIRDVDE